MGRTLMALVLLAAVTQAQVGVLQISQSQPVAMDPTVFAQPVVEAFPRYTALRRGTEEKVLLAASLNPTARGWTAIYWAAPMPGNGPLAATELKIEPLEGFSIGAIEYPKSQTVALRPDEEPVHVLGPGSIDLHLKVRADRTAALGDHVLKGKLKFQSLTRDGNSAPQELEFSIPIRVVEHGAVVAKNPRYHQDLTPMQITGVVLLIPLAIPFAIIAALTGWDGC